MRLSEVFPTPFHQGDAPRIDNENGAGRVPWNQDVDYFGFKVLMKPSTFLSLASSLSRGDASNADGLIQHMLNGGAIASPFLRIRIPNAWFEGMFDQPAEVVGHEGRNRCYALKQLDGDDPVEMHLFPISDKQEMRSRHVTAEMKAAINRALIREKTTTVISGPLFKLLT